MLINRRNEDLMKTFERRWKASHNNDVQNAKQKNQQFMDKMNGIRKMPPVPNQIDKLNNMKKNIEALNDSRRKFKGDI